jgi:hypothetical protein
MDVLHQSTNEKDDNVQVLVLSTLLTVTIFLLVYGQIKVVGSLIAQTL